MCTGRYMSVRFDSRTLRRRPVPMVRDPVLSGPTTLHVVTLNAEELAMDDINAEPTRPPVVPKDFGGQWVAWNSDATVIIANGPDLKTVMRDAEQTGEAEPSFEKIPSPDVRLIGTLR